MKQLSDRANSYIGRLERDNDWSCDRKTVSEYLEKQGISGVKPIVRYQSQYSGLDLTIQGNPAETFFMRMFSGDDVKSDVPVYVLEEENTQLFECGYHKTAQYNFYMNPQGAIVAQSGDVAVVIHSSAEMMIEYYAFLDSIAGTMQCFPRFYMVKDVDELLIYLMYRNFREVRDCSDSCHCFLTDGETVMNCSVYWDEDGRYCFTLYGKEVDVCEKWVEELKKECLITDKNIL